jgi:preprotein translocase subunit SecB
MTNGNGGTPQGNSQANPQVGGDKPPQLNVLAQYIKDFSFENPNAPRALQLRDQNPAINIQVGVNATPLEGPDVEVAIRIEGKAEAAGTLMFNFELVYAGAFRIQNVPQDILNQVVMIECPRLLFPFAREIIASAVSNGGFPPLLLEPVDFVGLYRQGAQNAQAGGAPANLS